MVISVIGAGTMGKSISLVFALAGYHVNVYEPSEQIRKSAPDSIRGYADLMEEMNVIQNTKKEKAMDCIQLYDNIYDAVYDADFVIEVIPENLEMKQNLFKELDGICKEECIFASNTSSLRLDDLMKYLSIKRKEKTLICHFYNPAHIMPIVELSHYGNMPEKTFNVVKNMLVNIGKEPVKVDKDVLGLVANRIQNAMAREIFYMIENEIAEPDEIDKALKYGPCFRYATTGQQEIIDMGGSDIWATVADIVWPDLEDRKDAPDILKEKVREGKLGIKTGEGFRVYPDHEKREEVIKNFHKRLMMQLIVSKKMNHTEL